MQGFLQLSLRRSSHLNPSLQKALARALASHRPEVLRRLASRLSSQDLAAALSSLSSRQRADALSLLPADQRALVLPHLPGPARRQWQELNAPTQPVSTPMQWLHKLRGSLAQA